MKCVAATVIVLLTAVSAFAQSARPTLASGLGMAIDLHDIGHETTSDPDSIRPTTWAEITWPISSRLSFVSGIDVPVTPFRMVFIHQGSQGYRADVRSRDLVLGQLIGFHLNGQETAGPRLLAGAAIVFSRRTEDLTLPGALLPSGFHGPTDYRTVHETHINIAAIGGFDWPIALSDRVSVGPRVRVRVAMPRTYRPYASLGVNIGATVAVRLGRE